MVTGPPYTYYTYSQYLVLYFGKCVKHAHSLRARWSMRRLCCWRGICEVSWRRGFPARVKLHVSKH